MKKYQRRGMKRIVASLVMLMVIVGLGFAGYSLFWSEPANSASGIGSVKTGLIGAPEKPSAPANTEMKLTVPKMERVKGVPIFTAPASDEGTLDKGALHVKGTGFPWQDGSNVYIAGHRLGYKQTGSYLQFFDLLKLKKGDEIILADSEGKRYTYTVFRKFRVDPSRYDITQPIAGKSIVSLQTCTLPKYTQRLIVQGELTNAK